MSNLALITADTGHAAATNTKTALEAKGHTVTLVADSTLGSFDPTSYNVLVAVRTTNTQTVADQLRAFVDAGKPALWGTGSLGLTAGTGRSSLPTKASLCGTFEVVDNTAGANGIRVTDNTHAATTGFSTASETSVFSAANYAQVIDTGQTFVGAELSKGDPSLAALASQVESFVVEKGTLDLLGVAIGGRVVVFGFLYGGQSAYTANGQTLLDQAVGWAVLVPSAVPTTGALTIAGTTPAIGVAPASGSLTFATDTPTAQVVVPTAVPATGELVLTGGDAPTMPLVVQPGTGLSLILSGGIPTVKTYSFAEGGGVFFALESEANAFPSHLGYGAGAFSLATSYGEAIKKHDAVGNGAFYVPTCTAKTSPQHLGHGNAAFSLLTGEAGEAAVGNGSFSFLVGEGTTVHGHAATGTGAFFAMAGTGTTGSKGAGAFNLLTGSSLAVKGQIITGAGAFSFLTGTGTTTKGHIATGSGALFLLAGAGGSVKGRLATGSAALRLLTGSGESTKGHGATGDGDLFLMTGTGQAGVRNDATGAGDFFLLKGSGMLDTTDPDYILHYRSPT